MILAALLGEMGIVANARNERMQSPLSGKLCAIVDYQGVVRQSHS